MTKNGNLDDIKKFQKSIPNDQFLRLKQFGNYTLLIFAASEGFTDIVEFLLSIGADPNEYSNVIDCMNKLDRMENRPCIEHATLTDWTL